MLRRPAEEEVLELLLTWGAEWDPATRDAWGAVEETTARFAAARRVELRRDALFAWLFLEEDEERRLVEALSSPEMSADLHRRARELVARARQRVLAGLEQAREEGLVGPEEEDLVRRALEGDLSPEAWSVLPRLARVEEEARARAEAERFAEVLGRLRETLGELHGRGGSADPGTGVLGGLLPRLLALTDAIDGKLRDRWRPPPGLTEALDAWRTFLEELVETSGGVEDDAAVATGVQERVRLCIGALASLVEVLPHPSAEELARRLDSLRRALAERLSDGREGLIPVLLDLVALERLVFDQLEDVRRRDRELLDELDRGTRAGLAALPPSRVLEVRSILRAGRASLGEGQGVLSEDLRQRAKELLAEATAATERSVRREQETVARERKRLLGVLEQLQGAADPRDERRAKALAARVEQAGPERLPRLARRVEALVESAGGRTRYRAARTLQRARQLFRRSPTVDKEGPIAELASLAARLEAALQEEDDLGRIRELETALRRAIAACRRRPRWPVAAAVAAVLLTGVAAAWWFTAGSRGGPVLVIEPPGRGARVARIEVYRLDRETREPVAEAQVGPGKKVTLGLEAGEYAIFADGKYLQTVHVPAHGPVRLPEPSVATGEE